MWVNRSLDRARRRLRPVAEPVEPAAETPVGDVILSVVRADLDRLIAALVASGVPGQPRPDSPARLEGALAAIIARIGGAGHPTVIRSPAGLYTPEYWHIRVEGADLRTRDAVGRLTAGGRIG